MSSKRSDDYRPRRNSAVPGRDLENEYLLLGETCDQMHRLNDTAREIYLLCDGTKTLAEIAQAVRAIYDVAPERARADVERVVEELEAVGVLTAS